MEWGQEPQWVMLVVKLNSKQEKHWLLGEKIGEGKHHIVFAKKKYVYKIRKYLTSNIPEFVEFVIFYSRRRNSIPFQIPSKFIGIAFVDNHIFPIFKQEKIEPMTLDESTFREQSIKLVKSLKCKYRWVEDQRSDNFGLKNGELKAIDVKLSRLSEYDNFLIDMPNGK